MPTLYRESNLLVLSLIGFLRGGENGERKGEMRCWHWTAVSLESPVNRVHKGLCGVEGQGSEVKKKRCTCTLHRADNELIQLLGPAGPRRTEAEAVPVPETRPDTHT